MNSEYCLGFVFDNTYGSVVLTYKSRGLHVGTWNGLGGKLNPAEHPVDGMHREYKEESNGYEIEHWEKVGFIEGPTWLVHVFAAVDPDCVDTLTADHILEHQDHGTSQVLLEGIEALPMAPYTMALIQLSIEKLKNPKTPLVTLRDAYFNEEMAAKFGQGDYHRIGAAHVLGIRPEDVTTEQRMKFKEAFYAAAMRRMPELVFEMLDGIRSSVLGTARRDISE